MRRPHLSPRATGLLLGYCADRLLGDPRRFHPVAAFGSAATELERRLYTDSRMRGVTYTVLLVGSVAGLGVAVERLTARSPIARTACTALATWAVLGGRSLEREATAVRVLLEEEDLPGARRRLKSLVGRDTSELEASEVSRAVVESVAENSSDAVVAPLLWGAVAGIPGLVAYRATNTLDAMVGHRSPRYERFGWASARWDDLLNLPGARLAGVLTAAAVPSRARSVLRTWRRDAGSHPSPNAGVVEASFAGALDLRLGGTNRYGTRSEHRPVLGDGRSVEATDIEHTTALARRVGFGAALTSAALAAVMGPPTLRGTLRRDRTRP